MVHVLPSSCSPSYGKSVPLRERERNLFQGCDTGNLGQFGCGIGMTGIQGENFLSYALKNIYTLGKELSKYQGTEQEIWPQTHCFR